MQKQFSNLLIPYSDYPHKSEYLEKTLFHIGGGGNLFQPRLIACGMIDWKRKIDASSWGGPFNEKYVGCRITDYSFCLNVQTIEVINLQETNRLLYSTYSIPNDSIQRIFSSLPYFKDCGHYYGLQMIGIDGKEYSRRELTQRELEMFLKNANVDELKYYESRINRKLYRSKEVPTKECPVKIYLFGNDDCSYTMTCPTEDDALEMIYKIVERPSMKFIQENFQFTN